MCGRRSLQFLWRYSTLVIQRSAFRGFSEDVCENHIQSTLSARIARKAGPRPPGCQGQDERRQEPPPLRPTRSLARAQSVANSIKLKFGKVPFCITRKPIDRRRVVNTWEE